jgi:hypothetical protein
LEITKKNKKTKVFCDYGAWGLEHHLTAPTPIVVESFGFFGFFGYFQWFLLLFI